MVLFPEDSNPSNSPMPQDASGAFSPSGASQPTELEKLTANPETALTAWEETFVAQSLMSQGILQSPADNAEPLLGQSGNDELIGGAAPDLIAGELGDDVISGLGGDDVLRGDRNSRFHGGIEGGDDLIFGGDGRDRIGGKGGNDTIFGEAGDDQIWGDAGDDIIRGGEGNDYLVGDNFSGNRGRDTFVLADGEGTDTIRDFRNGEDLIGLADKLTYAVLKITQGTGTESNDTVITNDETGEKLAILKNVDSSTITSDDFITVESSEPEPQPEPEPEPEPEPQPEPEPEPEPQPEPEPEPQPEPEPEQEPEPEPEPE
ncbi:MAG: hypothetical protein AAGF66_16835, partial [Cyanobacteria bacterium P01_H01_bin.119]